MKANEYLSQLQEMNIEIENKMLEKEQWKHIATGTSSNANGERVQSSGSGYKMEKAVQEYVEIEKQIDALIDAYVNKKEEIKSTIKQIPFEEYDFLYKVYLLNISLKECAVMKGKSYSWSTTMHKKAKASVQKIIDRRNNAKQG